MSLGDPFDGLDLGGGGDPTSGLDSGFLDAVVETIITLTRAAFFAVIHVLNQLIAFVQAFGQLVAKAFGAAGTLFSHLWNGFFKGIFRNFLNAARAAHDWLERHLRPVINFLRRIRALQDAYFNHYLRPLLNLLQHVRGFLQLLKLLHINIAAQLDSYIAGLESRLSQTFLTLRAAVNTAIDLVNILADPALLLRKPTLIASIRRTLPAISVVLTRRPLGYWFPSPRGAKAGFQAPVPFNYTAGDPSMNPDASAYLLSDDGIANMPAFSLLGVPSDSAVDDIDSLDYFDDAMWPEPVCNDPAACLNAALQSLATGILNG